VSGGDDYWYTGPRLEISLGLERDRLRRLESEADAQRARIEWIEGGRVGVHEIHDLGVGVRISSALRRHGVFNVPQLVRFTRAELDTIKGIGARALDTIEFALLVHGYVLQCEPEEES
jgi:DNA-directed RNA polymerase alpha subunit